MIHHLLRLRKWFTKLALILPMIKKWHEMCDVTQANIGECLDPLSPYLTVNTALLLASMSDQIAWKLTNIQILEESWLKRLFYVKKLSSLVQNLIFLSFLILQWKIICLKLLQIKSYLSEISNSLNRTNTFSVCRR